MSSATNNISNDEVNTNAIDDDDSSSQYSSFYPSIEQFNPISNHNISKKSPKDRLAAEAAQQHNPEDTTSYYYDSQTDGYYPSCGGSPRGHVNYYTLLGLCPTDSDADIRRAFRHLSTMFHPDRTVNLPPKVAAAMKARFFIVNEAYEILSDPVKRVAYDCLGKKGVAEINRMVPVAASSAFATDEEREAHHKKRTEVLSYLVQTNPAAFARLLRTSHEEKNLVATARRLGNTSEVEVDFNAVPFVEQVKTIGNEALIIMIAWLANDKKSSETGFWENFPWADDERQATIEKDLEVIQVLSQVRQLEERMAKEMEAEEVQAAMQKRQEKDEQELSDGRREESKPNDAFYSSTKEQQDQQQAQQQQQQTTDDNRSSSTSVAAPHRRTASPPPPPPPPKEPTPLPPFRITLESPTPLEATMSNQKTVAFIPHSDDNLRVTKELELFLASQTEHNQEVERYQMSLQKYQEEINHERKQKIAERRAEYFKKHPFDHHNNNNNHNNKTAQEIVASCGLDDDQRLILDPNGTTYNGLEIPKNPRDIANVDKSTSTRPFNRPPLHVVFWRLGSHCLVSTALGLRNVLVSPMSMSGRFGWQLPLSSNTGSLLSVAASRTPHGAGSIQVSLDGETKTSNFTTILWQFITVIDSQMTNGRNLRTMARNAFTAGFTRVISRVASVKMLFTIWSSNMKYFLPRIYLELKRTLTPSLEIISSITLPSPFIFMNRKRKNGDVENRFDVSGGAGEEEVEEAASEQQGEQMEWGNIGLALANRKTGFKFELQPGAGASLKFVHEMPFVFFPLISRLAKKMFNSSKQQQQATSDKPNTENKNNNNKQEAGNEQEEEEDEEFDDEDNNSFLKKSSRQLGIQKSAIKYLRRWTSILSFDVTLLLRAIPVLQFTQTLNFSRPFDALPTEKALFGLDDSSDDNDDDANEQQQQKKKSASASSIFAVSDSDSDDDHHQESSIDARIRQAEIAERRRLRTNNLLTQSQRTKMKIATLADSLLSHGFGISVTVAIPILHALRFSLPWPEDRFVNTIVTFSYKKGENSIKLPFRIAFEQTLSTAFIVCALPYVANIAIRQFISNWNIEKLKEKSVAKRVKYDYLIRESMEKAKLEQEGMKSHLEKMILEESKNPSVKKGGLVIVNAEYGILKPVLKYPTNSSTGSNSRNNNNNNHNSNDDEQATFGAAAASSSALSSDLSLSPLTCDATLAIQNLVRDSRIHIAGGNSKSILCGLYDPHPFAFDDENFDNNNNNNNNNNGRESSGERKQLKIVYRFRNRLHEVVVEDYDELRIPLVEHLVKI